MKSMTHRERVMAALNHQQPDRIPIDFGGARPTCIVAPAYEKLRKYMGLAGETRTYGSGRFARSIIPDEEMLRILDTDTRMLKPGEFRWKNQKVIDAETHVDVFGITWRQPPGSYSMDVEGPFQKSDPKIEILEEFPWPDPNDPGLYARLKERAEELRRSTDCAIIGSLVSFLSGIMKQSCQMRGVDELLMDLYEDPEFICRLMDILTDISIKIAENMIDAVGDNVDVVFYGDDLGHQQSTLISPKHYREFVKPRHKRFFAAVKARSKAKILLHSDGAIFPLIADLIEIGLDALNPIQVSARGMDPAKLKQEFGDRLTFWGGIDTRDILPFGSPDDVRAEVRRMIDILGTNGGYVLGSVQAIQAEVPPENIVTMIEEAKSYGKAR